MNYLKEEQYYTDLYDLHTIEECLDYYQAIKKDFQEKRSSEEFKKYTNKAFTKEVQKVLNVMTYTLKGEKFRNKASHFAITNPNLTKSIEQFFIQWEKSVRIMKY